MAKVRITTTGKVKAASTIEDLCLLPNLRRSMDTYSPPIPLLSCPIELAILPQGEIKET